jgi:two-component system C4-dicarboxylate transport response regulator DctD
MSDKGTIRILIIDDDAEFCRLLNMQISLMGYATEVAEDAVEGGKAILARPPNLVLCDINLPHMSGLDLVSLMQTDPRCASIPVIFVSGRNDPETITRAVELGAADFLAKPITRAELVRSVEACLKSGGRRPVVRDPDFPPIV